MRGESYRLTEDDAAVIRGLIERGERQQDIQAYFTVMCGSLNQGRIAEVATGERMPHVKAANSDDLPPPIEDIFEIWRTISRLIGMIRK